MKKLTLYLAEFCLQTDVTESVYSRSEHFRNKYVLQEKEWLVMALLQNVLSTQRSHQDKLCLMGQSVLTVRVSIAA
jgi:hypothetical protein